MKKVFYFILLSSFTFLNAQTNDNIIWASLKGVKKFNKKTSVAIAPILRLNNNIGTYQNSSLDLSVRHNFTQNWHLQLAERTWFVPNAPNRQLLWIDFGFTKKLEKIKISSTVRWHQAFDLRERPDADFIRWKSSLALLTLGKFTPFIGVEPWFRINEDKGFRRMRWEPGVKYKFSERLSFTAKYWREQSYNGLANNSKFNIYLITLAYTIPYREKAPYNEF